MKKLIVQLIPILLVLCGIYFWLLGDGLNASIDRLLDHGITTEALLVSSVGATQSACFVSFSLDQQEISTQLWPLDDRCWTDETISVTYNPENPYELIISDSAKVYNFYFIAGVIWCMAICSLFFFSERTSV